MPSVKLIYWLVTGLMCLIFAMSTSLYIFKHDMAAAAFESVGFPVWIIYPLTVAKVLGIIAVLSKKSKLLKEWAFAGFFFDSLLAVSAHYVEGHSIALSLGALVLTALSRFYDDLLYR